MRLLTMILITAAGFGLAAVLGHRLDPHTQGAMAQDRAIALGVLLDTPVAPQALDEGLRVAERLRQRYGIDTGNRHADRLAAAMRARRELLIPLDVPPATLRAAAERLGYSLDPARCHNTCGNVARLARLDLEKRALQAFADGGTEP